ncbi:MAG: DUF6249 domain-containing protein [Solimonas sp.]
MMLNLLSSAAATFQIDGLDAVGGGHDLDVTGLVAVILAFVLPAVIVIAVLLFRLRQQRLQNEIIAKLAASGQTVPPELFVAVRCQRSDLNRGLTMIAVGLAMALAFYLTGQQHAWPWALIPLFIGVARLLSWAVEGRNTSPKP